MTDVFFSELGIPEPEVHLEVGSGSHGLQTARILQRYEAHLLENRPSATVVFGDVNSTVACALAAVKLDIPVAHVEAGLRSFDRKMPEEINRLLTDAVSDLLLVSEPSGVDNLVGEGIARHKIRLVGNVMIDTLLSQLSAARQRGAARRIGLGSSDYGFVTLHRPSNVDDPRTFSALIHVLRDLAERLPLVFPIHPRTRANAQRMNLDCLVAEGQPNFVCLPPQSYLDTLSFMAGARVVLTDSGGVQEESSVLGVPCLTIRDNTERPITLTLGTSRLVGNDPTQLTAAFEEAVSGSWRKGQPIPYWDGHAGARIAAELQEWTRQFLDN
jgi:UDP-N-acetylglucosamine 2-epimerase (non-hydrolysing)